MVWTFLTVQFQQHILFLYSFHGQWCFWGSRAGKLWCSSWHLEKAMATHSSTLAWKIPWMEEPGRLQSMGLRRIRHDWATSLSLFTFMHWRRKWQPIPVFLPGESQGQRGLVDCHLWDRTESDTTEATQQQQQQQQYTNLFFVLILNIENIYTQVTYL